jgi:hypothetical protein
MQTTTSRLVLIGLALVLAGCGAFSESVGLPKAEQAVFEGPVAKATCGPGDVPEPALQGQVPLEDRVSGASAVNPYRCNLELVSQHPGEGASWQHAWHGDCAYYDTGSFAIAQAAFGGEPPPKPAQFRPGTVVVNAASSENLVVDTYLTDDAMLDPWESLKVAARRGFLGANELAGPVFSIYDATDCAHPQPVAVVNVGLNGHEGEWVADGNTYWGSDSTASYHAIDTADAANPRVIFDWNDFFTNNHGMGFSEDGNTGYFTNQAPNGVVITDISDIQQRRPNPQVRILSELYWDDGNTAQHAQAMTIKGVPYILFVDEGGKGAARIIDVSDPTNPKIISKLKLEVHMPENADAVSRDTAEGGFFGYEAHYCAVSDGKRENSGTTDTIHNAALVACGYIQSGLRIFDVRDPYNPREIAYYYPPAKPGYQPGSNYALTGVNQTAPYATSAPRIRIDRNEVWFTSQENGFQIVRFTRPLAELMGPAPR